MIYVFCYLVHVMLWAALFSWPRLTARREQLLHYVLPAAKTQFHSATNRRVQAGTSQRVSHVASVVGRRTNPRQRPLQTQNRGRTSKTTLLISDAKGPWDTKAV